jgi:hypothetical protein
MTRYPKCQHVIQAGPRKGLICGRPSLPHDEDHCSLHDPTGRLILKPEIADAIRRGVMPKIVGTGEPPVVVGHIRYLSPYLAFRVSRIKTSQDGWELSYVLNDRRPEFRNLRRTPSDSPDFDAIREAYSPENFKWDELPVVEEKRQGDPAEQSAYTGGTIGLVAETGEAPPKEFVDSIASGDHGARVDQRRQRSERLLRSARDLQAELHELMGEEDLTGMEKKIYKELRYRLDQLGQMAA